MQLTVRGVIPVPLREKILSKSSSVWNTEGTFGQGEYVFVQAPSGTGKTTLIHILYGLRGDYEGTVTWGDVSLTDADAETIARLRATKISVIFQDMRLFPELTAMENIDVKRKLTNTVSAEEAAEWLRRLGLGEKLNATARTLSYGEQQRVAIVRALLQPFEWLLMDEPFSHLDHANIDKARNLIGEVAGKHSAGMILADLDENTYFNYTQTALL